MPINRITGELTGQEARDKAYRYETKDARSNLEEGNLVRAYSESLGWGGCFNLDCLPGCRPSKNHCERLKLFLERGKAQ